MPLIGANIQKNVVGVFATLKSSFIASFLDIIKPLGSREEVSAFFLKLLSQLRQFLDLSGQDVVPDLLPFFEILQSRGPPVTSP